MNVSQFDVNPQFMVINSQSCKISVKKIIRGGGGHTQAEKRLDTDSILLTSHIFNGTV